MGSTPYTVRIASDVACIKYETAMKQADENQIEEDSPVTPLLLLAAMVFILIGSGLGMAYMGGIFGGKKETVASDKQVGPPTALIVPAH